MLNISVFILNHHQDNVDMYLLNNTKIKSGILIGFHPRALRICSHKFLNEFDYTENSFPQLQNHKSFPNVFDNFSNNNLLHEHNILLSNSTTNMIEKKFGIKQLQTLQKEFRK